MLSYYLIVLLLQSNYTKISTNQKIICKYFYKFLNEELNGPGRYRRGGMSSERVRIGEFTGGQGTLIKIKKEP